MHILNHLLGEHYRNKNGLKKMMLKRHQELENQNGGVGRHTAPPGTTRTDRKLNGKEVRHQVDKKRNIHPDR